MRWIAYINVKADEVFSLATVTVTILTTKSELKGSNRQQQKATTLFMGELSWNVQGPSGEDQGSV